MPLNPGDQILFTRQRHEADRMGLHWDYRLVAGDKAYSWATKKEMPEPGKAIVLFEQPVHDAAYALSEKVVIPKGEYGAGTTYLDRCVKARIGEHSTADQLTLHAGDDKFLLKKLPKNNAWGEKAWLFKNLGKQEMSENRYLEKIAQSLLEKTAWDCDYYDKDEYGIAANRPSLSPSSAELVSILKKAARDPNVHVFLQKKDGTYASSKKDLDHFDKTLPTMLTEDGHWDGGGHWGMGMSKSAPVVKDLVGKPGGLGDWDFLEDEEAAIYHYLVNHHGA